MEAALIGLLFYIKKTHALMPHARLRVLVRIGDNDGMETAFELFNIASPEIQCKVPSGTCLLAYRGSIAHNMYIPNSDPNSIDDVDLKGVVLGKPENYLGLHEWGSRGTKEVKVGKYDCVFYEIRKMVSLLLQGNPNVLSLLWTEPRHRLYVSGPGSLLIEKPPDIRGEARL